jgi:hypothetical protein
LKQGRLICVQILAIKVQIADIFAGNKICLFRQEYRLLLPEMLPVSATMRMGWRSF